MKKTLFKETLNSIKKEFKRFLFLVMIISLGVGFFVGMKSSSPLLKTIATDYVNENNFMDIRIISEMGLNDEELKDLEQQIPEIHKTEGSYEIDVVSNIAGVDVVVAVNSYKNGQLLNQVDLLDGKLPSHIHECVVEQGIIDSGYKIGDIIDLNSDYLKDDTVVISGVVRSPMYISPNRGTSNLLSGRITYYVYVYDDNFNSDYYSSGYITLENKYTSFTDEYNRYVEEIEDKIKSVSKEISQKRLSIEISEATQEIEQMEIDYNNAYNTALTQLANAEKEIKNAEIQIASGYKEIKTDAELDKLFSDKQKELDEAKSKLDAAKKTLDSSKEIYEKSQNLLNDLAYTKLLESKKIYENKIRNLQSDIDRYTRIANETRLSSIRARCLQKIAEKKAELLNTQKIVADLEKQINEYQSVITYPDYIVNAEKEYEAGLKKYNAALKEFNSTKQTAYAKMHNAKKQLDEKNALLSDKKNELAVTKAEKEKEFKEYRSQIESAKDQLTLMKASDWMTFSRSDISSYSQYSDDVESVSNLGKIFPIVFFLVACLMTMTSISRMIEQERSQVGTLKAFGYTNKQILSKYIFYAFAASIIGSLFGIIGGLTLIPYVIFKIYQLMYSLPNFTLQFNLLYTFLGTGIAVSTTVLTTYLVCRSTFKEIPCKLMKAKSAKSSKKMIIDRLPFINNKMKLTRKISLKNLFLFKKRLIMTIAGVAGCTALIVAGFGLQSSISDIVPFQFGKIFDLEIQMYYKNDVSRNQIEDESKRIEEFENVDKIALAHIEVVKIKIESKTHDVNFVIPADFNTFSNIVHLNVDGKNIETIPNDGIIISNKLAKFLNVEKGDEIEYTDNIGDVFKVKVAGICENYVEHYIYMSEELYSSIKSSTSRHNMLLVNTTGEYDEREFADKLNENDYFASMTFISVVENVYQDILHNLNMIVIVIVISAGMLAIIVLLNLSSINVSERKRELATLKVLGFTKKEVNNYVKREMEILSIFGVIIGLALGYVMTNLVISLCEIDQLEFVKDIVWKNYLYAGVITLIFSAIANNLAMKEIKNINMTESLKSID